VQVVDEIVERVGAVHGVKSAAITTGLPMSGGGVMIHFNRAAYPPAGPADYVMAGFRAVTPEYLSTLGVPLKRGRMLTRQDRASAPPVVVINETMARQFFPDREPIGERIQLGTEPDPGLPMMEIVGVVGDVKQSFEAGSKAEMFVPYAQFDLSILGAIYRNTALVVRTPGDPVEIVPFVRSALRQIDPDQPLVNVRTMEAAIAGTVAQPRFQMLLLVIFAGVAVALAAIGVYGVMAYTVTQRIQEIGVRIAIGASPGQVVWMVVKDGARLAMLGVVTGLAVAFIFAPALRNLLFGISALDPVSFAGAALVLSASALLASYIPARRAASVSPAVALRT
jgi:putative ABC transport system permease protein